VDVLHTLSNYMGTNHHAGDLLLMTTPKFYTWQWEPYLPSEVSRGDLLRTRPITDRPEARQAWSLT
jgi:hypothetical protein